MGKYLNGIIKNSEKIKKASILTDIIGIILGIIFFFWAKVNGELDIVIFISLFLVLFLYFLFIRVLKIIVELLEKIQAIEEKLPK